MASLESVILEVPDPAAAEAFNAATFGLGDKVRVSRDRSDTGLRAVLPRPDR